MSAHRLRVFSLFVLAVKFPAAELKRELKPIIDQLYGQMPEGLPFRFPVDPVKEQIPVSSSFS